MLISHGALNSYFKLTLLKDAGIKLKTSNDSVKPLDEVVLLEACRW
jgi:hypothetical protein